jgi:hypothetical protein
LWGDTAQGSPPAGHADATTCGYIEAHSWAVESALLEAGILRLICGLSGAGRIGHGAVKGESGFTRTGLWECVAEDRKIYKCIAVTGQVEGYHGCQTILIHPA